jgi:hypothetical protein
MMDEKTYYSYSYDFGSNDIEIHEMDYYDNEILNETNVGVYNDGVYHFYMYSDSKDNAEMFLSQISHILNSESRAASNLYHLASGRCSAFATFWKEYSERSSSLEKENEPDMEI